MLHFWCRWAAVPESEWPTEEAQRNVVLSDFDKDSSYGDRRQVGVIITCILGQIVCQGLFLL